MAAYDSNNPKSVYLETFGCQMNELDSELVIGQLRSLGYRLVQEPSQADILLYNTCSVRELAEQKVWSRLGIDKKRKEQRPDLVVGVLGCMAERDGENLIRRMPQVDILCGPGELDKLPGLLDNALRTKLSLLADEPASARHVMSEPQHVHAIPASARQVALAGNSSRRSATLAAAADSLEMLDLSRAITPMEDGKSDPVQRRWAYVRITRGCNKFCTYCIVPFTRGAEVHRPPEHIIDECKRLADAGVVEITLLGQTVNHYRFEHDAVQRVDGIMQPQKGRSYKGGHSRDPFAGESVTTFADLLYEIHEKVPGIERLRFVTSYPRDFGDDVLEVMRDCPRICRYLHVPAQSGSNRILQMMNRGYTVEEYLEFLERARGYLHQPEIDRPLTIAGDIIVGFPTETEEDYHATIGLLEKARYKNCFIFKYSPRPGTVAYEKLADDVPETVKRRRNNELLAIQQRISSEVGREFVGKTLKVFVEGLSQLSLKRQARSESSRVTPNNGSTISLTVYGQHQHHHDVGNNHAPSACEMSPSEGAATEESGSVQNNGKHNDESPKTLSDVQLSARTEGDLIVHIDMPPGARTAEYVGKIVEVTITESKPLSLAGVLRTQRE